MSDMHTIAHFLRLHPDIQHSLAEKLKLLNDADINPSPHTWLLRAKENGSLDALGLEVQLASQ